MQHRRRRGAVGLVLVAVVSGAAWLAVGAAGSTSTTAAASAPPVPLVAAAVAADGTPAGPPVPWTVTRVEDGVYELSFPAPTRVAVQRWEAAADVVVRPVSDRTWTVAFAAGGVPVDTAFSFLASPAAPEGTPSP